MSLLDDLKAAQAETNGDKPCPLCLLIDSEQDEETKQWLTGAAAGNIGRDKLVAVLAKHQTGIGKRTVTRHRQEGHKS